MSNPFSDLTQAFQNATGVDAVFWGIILGTISAVLIGLVIYLVLSTGRGKTSDSTMYIAFGVGVVFAVGVGWYPIWIPVFIAAIIVATWVFTEKR